MFPGITPDARNLATPFHKGSAADPLHLGVIATPFRSGHIADPHKLKHIMSFGRRSVTRLTDSWSSTEHSTQETAGQNSKTLDEEDEGDVASPRGPLSVRLSPAASQSDMEQQLTRTFGQEDLAAWE